MDRGTLSAPWPAYTAGMDELFQRSWHRAWSGLAAAGDGVAHRDALLQAYAEPQRHYHTLQHLHECLAQFDEVATLPPHPHAIEMALWFHDAVYDVKASDNEQRSADWAREVLREAEVDATAVERVDRLILATRHTATPADADEQLLVDIDLSILGAASDRFGEYEQQIRREYAFVPRWLFKRKRRAILQGFLDRGRIYSTAHFHDALETRARHNLRAAIAGRIPEMSAPA